MINSQILIITFLIDIGFPDPIFIISPEDFEFLRVLIIALTMSSIYVKSLSCDPFEQLNFLF